VESDLKPQMEARGAEGKVRRREGWFAEGRVPEGGARGGNGSRGGARGEKEDGEGEAHGGIDSDAVKRRWLFEKRWRRWLFFVSLLGFVRFVKGHK
jgi:hypothetical protein